MTDLFVSYKSEDRARVQPLVDALIADGIPLWWDAHIGGGDKWRDSIENSLAAAKCVLVVWSKRSIGAEGSFVRDEATRAQQRQAYLPVRIDAVQPPLGFGEIQALSLEGWRGKRDDARYVAVLETVRAMIAGQRTAYVPGRILASPGLARRRVLIGGGIVGLGAAGLAGWALWPGGTGASKRIAVMPFANMSGDPAQSYFSDGVAEELRSALSRIGLEVIGRASSEAVKGLDSKAAAATLGVANILTGSVRRSPETIRVGAELVGGADGVEKWAQTYDRAPGDTIKIQTDVAAQVAGALRIALGTAKRAALTLGGTADAHAQDLYLQAQALDKSADSAQTMRKAMALFDAAVRADPDYGDAWIGKASSLGKFASQFAISPAEQVALYAGADQAVTRAATLMPGSGRPSAMAAEISGLKLDFAGALQGCEQSLTMAPNDIFVLQKALNTLPSLGDGVQALAQADHLITVDPLNATAVHERGNCLYLLRRYAEAIAACNRSLALAPQRSSPHLTMAWCLTLLNRAGEARAQLVNMPVDDAFRLNIEAILATRGGDHAGAEAIIVRIRAIYGDLDSYQYGQVYAQMGDADRAFAAFDKGIQVGDPGLIYLKRDPFLDPIRRDPRFAALLSRLKFP